jgi:hypothetical protein
MKLASISTPQWPNLFNGPMGRSRSMSKGCVISTQLY